MDVASISRQAAHAAKPAESSVRPARPAERDDAAVRQRLMQALAGPAAGDDKAAVPARVEVRMSLDRDIERVIARVVDSDTGEVVREVPPEDLVELARTMKALLGVLLDKRA